MNQEINFPSDDSLILLTEEAKFDNQIADKIEKQVRAGKTVVITSGLLAALQDKGIMNIAEIRYTNRKALVKIFKTGFGEWIRLQNQS